MMCCLFYCERCQRILLSNSSISKHYSHRAYVDSRHIDTSNLKRDVDIELVSMIGHAAKRGKGEILGTNVLESCHLRAVIGRYSEERMQRVGLTKD